jgi:transketolase
MASITELSADNPALATQAAILASPAPPERQLADAIRALAIDAV